MFPVLRAKRTRLILNITHIAHKINGCCQDFVKTKMWGTEFINRAVYHWEHVTYFSRCFASREQMSVYGVT